MSSEQVTQSITPDIFRTYDIRGVAHEQLDKQAVYTIGRALASLAYEKGEKAMAVARDGRLSGPELKKALIQGILDAGLDVLDVGIIPTALLYFTTCTTPVTSGVMLTGSHNPAQYNGLKMVVAGQTLSGDDVQGLYQRIQQGNLREGQGSYQEQAIISPYIDHVAKTIQLARPLKVVIDCGNGVGGVLAEALFKRLGCEVVPLFCEVDGTFPNHHPDPTIPENLHALIDTVKAEQAHIGLAFDGDADRLGVVTNQGQIIWPDRQMILFARDVLSRHPGTSVVFDVKCSRHLPEAIEKAGGKPIMWRTGHSLLKARLHQDDNALLAGEMSGHIFFKERWFGFDDGLYVGARLLEILSQQEEDTHNVFANIPDSLNTPELKLPVSDAEKAPLMEKLATQADFGNATLITIDGLRVEFSDGWGLVRPSNTTPYLTLRFEAETTEALERIQDVFRAQLLALDENLQIPWYSNSRRP